MDLADRVAAALERSVLPSVIARGAGLRVAAVADGVAILEVTGSPGAALPLVSRIEALIRVAVPEITGVRITGPGAGPPGSAAGSLAERARRVLDAEINPVIAAHRGHVALAGLEQGWVRIRFEGGCQGCSLAEVTLRQGIEPLLRARLPGMTGLVLTCVLLGGASGPDLPAWWPYPAQCQAGHPRGPGRVIMVAVQLSRRGDASGARPPGGQVRDQRLHVGLVSAEAWSGRLVAGWPWI